MKNASLLIDARYSPNSGYSLEGSPEALVTLADALESESGGRFDFDPRVRPAEGPQPYDEFVDGLVLIPGEGAVRIEKQGRLIEVSGAPDKLGILADNIRDLALGSIPGNSEHMHIEYHPDHYFLDESAEPVMVERTSG